MSANPPVQTELLLSPQSSAFTSKPIPRSPPTLQWQHIQAGTKIRNLESILDSSLLPISCLYLNPPADSTSKYISVPPASLHICYPGAHCEAGCRLGAESIMDSSGFYNPDFVTPEGGDSCPLPALTCKFSEKRGPSLGHMEEKGQFPKGEVVLWPEEEQKEARWRKPHLWRAEAGDGDSHLPFCPVHISLAHQTLSAVGSQINCSHYNAPKLWGFPGVGHA